MFLPLGIQNSQYRSPLRAAGKQLTIALAKVSPLERVLVVSVLDPDRAECVD